MYARRAASYYCKVQCGVDISTSAVARAEHEAVSSGLPLRSAHATTHKTRSWPVGMLALLLHENRTYVPVPSSSPLTLAGADARFERPPQQQQRQAL